jgi:hypothetical protein
MTMRFGSKCVSLVLLAPFVALAACAPTPAKLMSPADQRYLEIRVVPPILCSDLKIDVVNSYAGCERFGGMMDGDKFTKYDNPVDASALMTAVDVRCYDLRPERIRLYAVCKPIVLASQSVGNPRIVNPEPPAPSLLTSQNTSGTGNDTASTFVLKSSSGLKLATANAGDTSASATSIPQLNGDTVVRAGDISVTLDKHGNIKEHSGLF